MHPNCGRQLTGADMQRANGKVAWTPKKWRSAGSSGATVAVNEKWIQAVLPLITLAALAVAASAAAAPARPIRFERLSLEQGLSQSSVMDVLQDSQGYVWLATEDGLNRFDGLSFRVLKHEPGDTRPSAASCGR